MLLFSVVARFSGASGIISKQKVILFPFSHFYNFLLMRSFLLVLPALIMLSGCGNNEEDFFKNEVRRRLQDPSSAQFKDIFISQTHNNACIIWNAKNIYGGYGKWSIAQFMRSEKQWILTTMEGEKSYCSEEGLKKNKLIFDAGFKEEEIAERKIMKKLMDQGSLSMLDAQDIVLSSKYKTEIKKYDFRCKNVVSTILSNARMIGEFRAQNFNIRSTEEEQKKQFSELDTPYCQIKPAI